MEFKEPFKVYTAANNLEAHLIVELLEANGIAAIVHEDQSGVSLWAFGTISQFHQPNIWIDKSTAKQAADLIRQFEERQQQRANPTTNKSQIQVECEKCGKTSLFPDSLNGTTQECPYCRAYVDVGTFEWNEQIGEMEE